MAERLKTALQRTAKFVVISFGAIACIACAVGLYHGHLFEPNGVIRTLEIIILSINAIILFVIQIRELIEIVRGELHGR